MSEKDDKSQERGRRGGGRGEPGHEHQHGGHGHHNQGRASHSDERDDYGGGPEDLRERLRGMRGRFAGRGGFGGPGHHLHNFWQEWRQEWDRGTNQFGGPGQDPSPAEREALHAFFQQYFGTSPEDHWIFGGRRFSPWHQGMDSFNPFVANLLSKGGGLLPLYVLHLVAQQPRYGNEIMDLLAERTNGQWVSNPGAVYPLLGLLERKEYIRGEWADPSKRSVRIYTITEAGQEELDRLKTIVGPKIEETIQVLQELMQELQGEPPADDEAQAAGSDPKPDAPAGTTAEPSGAA